jgi:hypothetical protein
MKTRTKIILWASPLLVIVLTYLYIYIVGNGLNVPWKFVGKPSENIAKIIGFNTGKLYVETDSGEMYALQCSDDCYSMPSPIRWVKDKNYKKGLDPIYDLSITSPPPFFKVKQIYQFSYPAVESLTVTKFALSEDGNLWYWTASGSGLEGFFFFMTLAGEILLYVLALFINFVVFLAKRIIRKNRS